MRFAYIYFLRDDPDGVRESAPSHADYWRDLELPGYLGGPFADRLGGLITFEADSLTQAEALAATDPFREDDLIDRYWVNQWEGRA